MYLHRSFGERETSGIVESGIQDSGRLQTVAVRDCHKTSGVSRDYPGQQKVTWYTGCKSIGHQASWRSTSRGHRNPVHVAYVTAISDALQL